jgi:hypothetical protein
MIDRGVQQHLGAVGHARGRLRIADASDRATEFGRLITSVNKNSYDFCDRRSNIVRVRWLEPRPPVAEHRISRQGPPNCLTVRQFLARQRGGPPQEGRHPRRRPRARAHPPSIRPSPPGTVQGLLRRARILFAQHQKNHGTVQTQTSTTPHDQSGTQGTRHSGTGAGHHADHQAADEDQTAVRTLR